jgi:hypothetical protein
MSKPSELAIASEERAKAFAAFYEASQAFIAFQTLKPTGLVQLEQEEGVSEAACDAAAEYAKTLAIYKRAVTASREALARSREAREKAIADGYIFHRKPEPEDDRPGSLKWLRVSMVAAQRRGVPTKTLQRIVMEHGGRGPASSGKDGPSLKALHASGNAVQCVNAIEALPS